ncbi:MAG: O-antigen ligase family protein [Acidobacteria bacterium]|nr:O-antigen ligase family protein [Acidobacteriota bacterium]
MNQIGPADAHYSLRSAVPNGKVPSFKLDWILLAQVSVCVVPAMGLVALGNFYTGVRWFFTILLLLLTRFLLTKNRLGFVSLLVSSIPPLMLLRGFFYYNASIALLATGIVLWFIASPKEFSQLSRDVRSRWLFFLGGFYWLLSYLWTGQYFNNLRVLELVFSAASVYLLARHREYLATALIGISISAFSTGLVSLTFSGERLGSVYVDGYEIGNPISFGIPLALIFLLSIADNGKWLLLESHRYWRLSLGVASGALLILSASRGSWAIVVVNVMVLLLIGRRQRGMLLVSIVLLTLVTLVLLETQRGSSIVTFYERTFSPDRTLSQRSTGRSDQWLVFPRAFQDSPIWGFGPGSGNSVYGKYSTIDDREIRLRGYVAWHSLYLLVGIETGIIGLMALTLLLAPLLFRALTHQRLSGESVPLLGAVGFLVIGLSVTGMDAASGVFLGLGSLSAKGKAAHRFHWERGMETPGLGSYRDRVAVVNPLVERKPSRL